MNVHNIAELSGVSIATVSRVINERPEVSDATRKKVLSVIQEIGFTPNAYARGLGLNTMKMIGILCTDLSDIYYAKAVSLVEQALRDKGFDSLVRCTGSRLEDKKNSMDHLFKKGVDAVILIGSAFWEEKDNSHIRRAAKQVPVIIINGLITINNVYCVLCDEKEAMKQNVGFLVNKDCTNILYLYDVLTYSGIRKLEGVRAALEEYGVSGRQEQITFSDKSIDAIKAFTEDVLEKDQSISAIITSSDLFAVGAQKAIQTLGLDMPLIGFDNSIYAQCANPAITSVDNGLETLCPLAVNMLGDILNGKKPPQKLVVSAKLVERETFVI